MFDATCDPAKAAPAAGSAIVFNNPFNKVLPAVVNPAPPSAAPATIFSGFFAAQSKRPVWDSTSSVPGLTKAPISLLYVGVSSDLNKSESPAIKKVGSEESKAALPPTLAYFKSLALLADGASFAIPWNKLLSVLLAKNLVKSSLVVNFEICLPIESSKVGTWLPFA